MLKCSQSAAFSEQLPNLLSRISNSSEEKTLFIKKKINFVFNSGNYEEKFYVLSFE